MRGLGTTAGSRRALRPRVGILSALWVGVAAPSGACGAPDRDSGDHLPRELDHARFDPVDLEGVVLHAGDLLSLPARIEATEEYLVLIDAASDWVVHVFNANDGTHVGSSGRRGEGPGEFRGAWSIDPAPHAPGEFWIYDLSLRRMTRFQLEADRIGTGPGENASVRLLADAALLDPLWADTLLVTLGFFPTGRLGHFDATGRFLRAVGETPGAGEAAPTEVRQHAYQSRLAADPTRTRFVVATRHADLLEIHSADGTLLARAEPPFGFLPRYDVRERAGRASLATGQDLRFGYVDLAATENRIYALFSGRTRRGSPGAASLGQHVHVYDFTATLVHVFLLDAPAIAIAASADGRELYAVRHHPAPAVVRYALPRDEP